MKRLILVLCVAVGFTGCGGAANKPAVNTVANTPANTATTPAAEAPGKMYVKWVEPSNMNRSKDITIKQGIVRVSTAAPKAAGKMTAYEIVLANYAFDAAKPDDATPKQYGDVQLFIQVLAEKDGLKEGSIFAAGQGTDGSNKVWSIAIKYSDDGLKDAKISAETPSGSRQGQLKITSVANGKLTGEIEIFDEKGKVKGSFVADMPKN